MKKVIGIQTNTPASESIPDGTDINIQTYTPSILLQKGQWEFKNFNNLYTQTSSFDSLRKKGLNRRENYFSSINQFLYGINDKINVGFDVWVKSVHIQNETSASPLDICTIRA